METGTQKPPKRMDQLRAELRAHHYSIRTEHAYLDWARRFIFFTASASQEYGAERGGGFSFVFGGGSFDFTVHSESSEVGDFVSVQARTEN
jgi:hypothetical protein